MAKRSKQYVPWLAEGERGWQSRAGTRWKWDGKQGWLLLSTGWTKSDLVPSHFERDGDCEVYPRPAAKPPKVVKVRAWALLDNGKLRGLYCARRDAKSACPLRFGWTIVKLEGTYTPKGKKR